MTAEQFDIHEPYRALAFLMLTFRCEDCRRWLEIDPPYGTPLPDYEWYEKAADQAWRAGWYVPGPLADGSQDLYCLCPECAAKKRLSPPSARR